MGKSGFIIALILGALVIFVVFLPTLRQWWLKTRADEVTINYPFAQGSGTRDFSIVSILGRDGIPAILKPDMVSADFAAFQMDPNERVLGLSIKGDHRAYPLNMLSRHEIVNDEVGGTPVAVTW